jgi:uncharacterized protein YjbI with pentapeptide repeats
MANAEHLKLLQQDVNLWNDWRKKEPSISPDLCDADLRAAHLRGADLHGANLRYAKLHRVNLSSANVREADLTALVWGFVCQAIAPPDFFGFR